MKRKFRDHLSIEINSFVSCLQLSFSGFCPVDSVSSLDLDDLGSWTPPASPGSLRSIVTICPSTGAEIACHDAGFNLPLYGLLGIGTLWYACHLPPFVHVHAFPGPSNSATSSRLLRSRQPARCRIIFNHDMG